MAAGASPNRDLKRLCANAPRPARYVRAKSRSGTGLEVGSGAGSRSLPAHFASAALSRLPASEANSHCWGQRKRKGWSYFAVVS